jgi:lipopolysaccharide/colanic/teichoic acid biosynthesis glycosyltransferase
MNKIKGKRMFDVIFSLIIFITFFPILIIILMAVWIDDKQSPFYLAKRVGKNNLDFTMIKIRSMRIDAEKFGINSTSSDDERITRIGHFIRRFKLDEIFQFLNVIQDNMSIVGPRPNTRKRGVDLYTSEEMKLLRVKPGVTDFSSIVFSDEGKILENKEDPDLAYNQLIRPWKSRLGLIYIKHQSILLDIEIIIYTLVALISKRTALNWVSKKLENLGVDRNLVIISKREIELFPYPPPGLDYVITTRK